MTVRWTEETRYEIPDKCKTCDMPDKYRPENPGCCGVCFQNSKANERR